MRWVEVALALALGCSTPPEAFCVDTSMAAFCGRDARGDEYRPVCAVGTYDGGGGPEEPLPATCTGRRIDPCPDGSAPVCVPVR